MNTKLRIGIYARVSTNEQHNENQICKLKEYAKLREWDIADIYQDVVSGKTFERPELERMKKDIKLKKINGVLVWKIDRLGRSTKDMIELADFFYNHNTSMIIFNSNIDTTTPMGKYVFITFSALAELERLQISERTKLAYERKKAHANAINQKIRWGRKSKKFTEDEEIYINELIRLDTSWRKISELVNKNRDEENKKLPKKKHLPKISYSTIRRVFQNRGVENEG